VPWPRILGMVTPLAHDLTCLQDFDELDLSDR
jgi:hypothetical protein